MKSGFITPVDKLKPSVRSQYLRELVRRSIFGKSAGDLQKAKTIYVTANQPRHVWTVS